MSMKSRTKAKRGGWDSGAGGFGGFAGSGGAFAPKSGSLSYLEPPPALSDVDPAVAVSFKNVLKKDPITKAKGLDDLVSYARSHPYDDGGGVADAVLDAWVSVYPRAAIDNSRQVRELAHTLQLELMRSARKRMEKRIPKVVGTWLAASFDKDRLVARTVNEGLASFMNTEEKQIMLWKKCKDQILAYASAAYAETPDTLSDPRNTTKDDALAVHQRVTSGSLVLVTRLLEILDTQELPKSEVADFFEKSHSVGQSLTSSDPQVRKAAFRLLQAALGKDATLVDIRHLKRFVAGGWASDQQGSALEFLELVLALIDRFPEIWTPKELSVLVPFLKKGSHGASSPERFWNQLDRLFAILPQPKSLTIKEASQLAQAMRVGLSQRIERATVPAWTTYLSITQRIAEMLQVNDDDRAKFLLDNVTPLLEQYMFPSPDKSDYATGTQIPTLTRAVSILSEDKYSSPSMAWLTSKIVDPFISSMSGSAPESSKSHTESQNEVGKTGGRWFALMNTVWRNIAESSSGSVKDEFARFLYEKALIIVEEASRLLQHRNYKPYGAALVLKAACASSLINSHGSTIASKVFPADSDALHVLLSSPSAPHLISCLNSTSRISSLQQQYREKLEAVIKSLLQRRHQPESVPLIARTLANTLAESSATPIARSMPILQDYLNGVFRNLGVKDSFDFWELFVSAYDSMTPKTLHDTTAGLVQRLADLDVNKAPLLQALEVIAEKSPALLTEDESLHLDLITKLLGMMELADASVSGKADALRSRLSGDTKHGTAAPIAKIIQDNLEKAGPTSLEIDTLVKQAVAASKTDSTQLEDLFPSTTVWMKESLVFLQGGLDSSLSLTSSIGGAYLLVSDDKAKRPPRAMRDRKGLSIPARMSLFTSKMLSAGISFRNLPLRFQAEILYLLHLAVVIGSDQVATMDDDQLWGPISRPEIMALADEAISSIRESINSIVLDPASSADDGEGSFLDALLDIMMKQTRELSPMAVYSAKAMSENIQTLVETRGFSSADSSIIAELDGRKATSSDVMGAIGILAGYGEFLASNKAVNNLCNRLVSDVAGAKVDGSETLIKLVLLNACMAVYEPGKLPVANNRLVFAVRQITEWLENTPDLDRKIATESLRALQLLLPCVKDIYGPYWQRTIDFSLKLWQGANKDDPPIRLAYIHASLKLLTVIENLEDPNDDLADVLQTSHEARSQAMLELLQLPRYGNNQAEDIVDMYLCRQVVKIRLEHVQDLEGLYGLIASGSREIQNAAFGLLHRALPASLQDDEVVVQNILDKKTARLPDELLSLLVEAPTLEAYPDDVLSRFPTPIRSYLLAWLLIFDCFAASPRSRNDYAENLKASDKTKPFLDFLFDVLGHSAAAPFNLDKEGFTPDLITAYDINLGDTEFEERDMQWLLINVFYLTLKYTPGLFKAWYLDCSSKQTRMHVEAWTTRYFSPLIINDLLAEVAEWAASQPAPADDEKELVIKTSRSGREVTASYEIDDETAAIAIKIPPSFPIQGVSVHDLNRVAVDEGTWRRWMMGWQGLMIFGGSVVDGLNAFRRNMVSVLRGHTECAICYSILSSDKRTPDKECGTCRNMFHRTCLYKWFQTSGQNHCPLCRNPIDYLGATSSRRGGERPGA